MFIIALKLNKSACSPSNKENSVNWQVVVAQHFELQLFPNNT